MILAQSLAAVRAQRMSRVLPDGRAIWVSQVLPASGATPETPTASFVEQLPHTVIPSHFHAVNQFQVVVHGQGTLGKRVVHPWTVHYTNGYTGYGALVRWRGRPGLFHIPESLGCGRSPLLPRWTGLYATGSQAPSPGRPAGSQQCGGLALPAARDMRPGAGPGG